MTKPTLAQLIVRANSVAVNNDTDEDWHILATLKWLEKWEPVIRQAVNKHQKAMAVIAERPVAQAVMDEFPEAIVSVEDPE